MRVRNRENRTMNYASPKRSRGKTGQLFKAKHQHAEEEKKNERLKCNRRSRHIRTQKRR